MRFFLLVYFLYLIISPSLAHATPYNFNTDPLTPTWTTIPISAVTLISDTDHDGIADVIYSSGGGATFSKLFGSVGQNSISFVGGPRDVYGDRILTLSGSGPAPFTEIIRHYSISSGAIVSYTTTRCAAGTSIGDYGGIIDTNNKTSLGFQCTGGGSETFRSEANPALNSTTVAHTSNYVTGFGMLDVAAGVYVPAQRRLYVPDTNSDDALANVWTKNIGSNRTSPNTFFELPAAKTTLLVDRNIEMYYYGYNMTSPQQRLFTNTYLKDIRYPASTSDITSLVINLPSYVLKASFTTPMRTFFLESGSNTYLATIDASNIYYTDYNTLLTQYDASNRALTQFIVDYSQVYNTQTMNSSSASSSITAYNPDSTSATITAPLRFVVPSGYWIQSPTLNRYYYPQYTNTLTDQPLYTTAGTHSNILINVNNAPSSSSIKILDLTNYNNTLPWVHTISFLEADDSLTVGLVQSRCFEVFVADSSLITPIWSDLGQICTNGATTKNLVYTTNLSFTFWTLPWGVSSEYDPDTGGLDTLVRSSEANYTYNLRVYDRNGTLSLQQQYTNQNGLSQNSFNITSIQTPATLQILDINNNTLYHATMGNGNWLTNFQSFANQNLTIDGFNLVAMMPLIFAAMWTRNTVSMGSMMTVVMIATLGFFGVLAIPEIVLYLMLFIAAIAMVAYKLMY